MYTVHSAHTAQCTQKEDDDDDERTVVAIFAVC